MSSKSFVDAFGEDLSQRQQIKSHPFANRLSRLSQAALGGGCELAMMISLWVVRSGSHDLWQIQSDGYEFDWPVHGSRRSGTIGLVSRVVPVKNQVNEAWRGDQNCRKIMIAVMAVKEMVNRSYETTLREGLLLNAVCSTPVCDRRSERGMAAYGKRSPIRTNNEYLIFDS